MEPTPEPRAPDTAGIPFDSVEAGEGEPIVLVHGSSSDRRSWTTQVDRLSRRYRVMAYSRRYHWPNPPIGEGADYAMGEQVDDLVTVIRAQPEASVHLVGHSYGAVLSLLVAIEHPELVRSLVLVEPPALTLFVSNRPKPFELLRVLFTRPRTALAIIELGAKGFGPATAAVKKGRRDEALEIFGSAVLGPETFRALSPERLAQARANFIDAELTGSGIAPLPLAGIRSLPMPVLLVCGQRSPRVFHRFADRLEELIPKVERVEISDASHIVHEDNPCAFAEAVHSFVSEVGAEALPQAQGGHS